MYRRNEQRWMKHHDFILCDILALCLAFWAGYYSYFKQFAFWNEGLYMQSFLVLILIDISCLMVGETYKNVLKRTEKEEAHSTIVHWSVVMLLHLIWLYFTQVGPKYPRRTFLITCFGYLILSSVIRVFLKRFIRKKVRPRKRLLILTTLSQAESDIESLKSVYEITAICILDKKTDAEAISGVPVVDKASVVTYAVRNWIDEVYVGAYQLSTKHKTIMRKLVDAGFTTHIALKRLPALEGSIQIIDKVNGEYVITSALATMTTFQAIQKRTLDILGGLVGTLITLILIPFVGWKIYKADPGPIFYAAERVGQNGKPFKMYKFRSMVMNADALKESLQKENTMKDGMMFKIDHDPRIIGGENGIGEFIRRTSLDEFPQFINVLLGQMSLVGTRPPTLDEWEKYKPHHRARMSSKPGITGLWQVSGRSDIKDFEQVVALDREYITNWSIWADIKILLKTIAVVFKKTGSY